jgi:hypothetical protein
MTRDDTPTGVADPDDANEPSLAAARAAWRALREPLEPGPDLDARIRAAARSAAASTGSNAGSAAGSTAGAPAALRARSGGHARRYVGWGLALAAVFVGGVVFVLPPAPLSDLPVEAPAHAPAPARGPASATGAPAHGAPSHGAPSHVMASPSAAEAVDATAPMPPVRAAPLQSAPMQPVAMQPAPSPEAAPVDAQAAAPAPPSPDLPMTPDLIATPERPAKQATAPARALGSAADMALAGRDDAAAIARELAELRALLRTGDPALPARLRAFVERYPGHPLAGTDPALAEVLARDDRRP